LKRLGPDDKENKINSFHLPSKASSASLIERAVLGHPPLVSM
jgi:hypothetical protein